VLDVTLAIITRTWTQYRGHVARGQKNSGGPASTRAICGTEPIFPKERPSIQQRRGDHVGFDRFSNTDGGCNLDSDILLPDISAASFSITLISTRIASMRGSRGCNRPERTGYAEGRLQGEPQHAWSAFVIRSEIVPLSPRYVDSASRVRAHRVLSTVACELSEIVSYSLGTAAHDDVMFAAQWPLSHRRHLPTVVCYHLCAQQPTLGKTGMANAASPDFAPAAIP